ncbi:uncharacterized protein LOC129412327 isoform X2 [Boleophthalmus pectinirostris]|uniref:uncharacterized protein LOC129412327 isoform X2 n=1 Tax=Boleophthalmus pectinirostris TaxID=150288 RepID=UPI00242ACDB1|nr:uncharacterized protein LOC129412327 isoform X2 [Boleophthalmus pectinirostris]
MNEKTKSHDACDKNWSGLTASTPYCSSKHLWLPVEQHLQLECTEKQEDKGGCNTVKSNEHPPSDVVELFCPTLPSAALAPLALGAYTGPHTDVLKQGYLGKQEHKHRRYFVLRAGSHSGPSRLEWYKTQERFTAVEKSADEEGFFGSHKQGVIFLRCCLGVSLIRSSRKDYKVALYAKDQTIVFVGKDEQEQQEWYTAIKELMEEELQDADREGFDEEDAGYCTLPPASFFKQLLLWSWYEWAMTMRCPQSYCPCWLCGASVIWMDLSFWSWADLHLMGLERSGWKQERKEMCPWHSRFMRLSVKHLFALKRSRPKQREKLGHCRPNSGPQVLCGSLHSHNHSDPDVEETLRPDNMRTEPSSEPEADSYMEMKTEHSLLREGPGYVLMTPQLSQSLHQDDYVSMTSPQKQALTNHTSLSFLQTSYSSDSDVQTPPPWTLFSGQQSNPRAVTVWSTSSTMRRAGGLRLISLFGRTSLEAVNPLPTSQQPVRRGLLSCLPSCLQPNRS